MVGFRRGRSRHGRSRNGRSRLSRCADNASAFILLLEWVHIVTHLMDMLLAWQIVLNHFIVGMCAHYDASYGYALEVRVAYQMVGPSLTIGLLIALLLLLHCRNWCAYDPSCEYAFDVAAKKYLAFSGEWSLGCFFLFC
jgi:hypothetical protein